MPDLSIPIDAYCERVHLGIGAEPFNLATNVAFLVAAAAILLGDHGRAGDRLLLGWLVFAVGIGSALFHSFATRLTAFADVVPIVAFIVAALWLALVRLVGFRRGAATVATVAFLAAGPAVAWAASGLLGGSSAYLPALVAILAVAAAQALRRAPGAATLAVAGLVFAVSLAARTADMPLCEDWPPGTHLAWHLLNALVLYLVARAILAAHRQPASTRRGTGTA